MTMKNVLLILCLVLIITMSNGSGLSSTPRIVKPPEARTIYANEGQRVHIECQVSAGDESVQYGWTSDGKPIQSDKKKGIRVQSRKGVLTIYAFNKTFDGDYQCIATIGKVSRLSHIQTLRMRYLGPFGSAGKVTKLTVTEYDYLKLNCADQGVIVTDPNDFSYNWYMGQDLSKINGFTDQRFIDQNGNLHFAFFGRTDWTSGLQCGYSSQALKLIQMGNLYQIDVESNTGAAYAVRPQFQYSNTNLQVKIGGTARLECFISGYDLRHRNSYNLPRIQWFDGTTGYKILNNTMSNKFAVSSNARVLVISNVTESDEKSYFCQGTTSIGQTEKEPVFLNVTSPPIWVVAPQDVMMPESHSQTNSAVFNCNARSMSNEIPPEEPVWYINGIQADTRLLDKNRLTISPDKKQFTVINPRTSDDSLCVQCVVRNSVGSLWGDACLKVIEPIKITKKPPSVQNIRKGDPIWLTVKILSDAPVGKEWEFRNKTSATHRPPPFLSMRREKNGTALLIDTTPLTDEEFLSLAGVYTCHVTNGYESINVTTEVRLLDDNTSMRGNWQLLEAFLYVRPQSAGNSPLCANNPGNTEGTLNTGPEFGSETPRLEAEFPRVLNGLRPGEHQQQTRDETELFLLSLAPNMRSLDPLLKIECQVALQRVLSRFIRRSMSKTKGR